MSLRGFEKSEVIHNIYSFFKNWIATPHAARNDNFNYTYALKNNFASLNNNVAVAHCVNNSEKSAQGVTTPCYSGYAFSYDLKNNFIIPNLVKTILTSITFDSLSERNLCLVIKKFNYKEFNMNNTKTIFKSLLIMIVAISLFTVSCSKDEGKPTSPAPSTPITITADSITKGFTALGKTKNIDGLVFDFSVFIATKTGAELTAQDGKASNNDALKTALGNLGISITGATVKSEVTGEIDITKGDNINVKVTITPSGNNTLDSKVSDSYTVNNAKAVEVSLILKTATGKKWNEKQK